MTLIAFMGTEPIRPGPARRSAALARRPSSTGRCRPACSCQPLPASLQRVVNVMQQFLNFPKDFNINSMLLNGG
jgi:hypothetical protein